MTTMPPPPAPPPPSQRPPSPTELSYTQLVKRVPPSFGGRAVGLGRDGACAAGNDHAVFAGPPGSGAAAPLSASFPSAPSAPRTAPPASIRVPRFDDGVVGGPNRFGGGVDRVGHPPPGAGRADYYRTPGGAQQASLPMSAPQPQQASWPAPGEFDPTNPRSTPVEVRLSNLASKLRAAPTHAPDSQPWQQQHRQPLAQRRSDRLDEVHQFVETLKTMHMAVSRTADAQQRAKKARALNALLSMFESIVEERQAATVAVDPSSASTIRQLDERLNDLEAENERLNDLLRERDGQLRQADLELQRSRRDLDHSASENEQLRNELERAREECHGERQRSQEAELVASESEAVRDGILADYARLTEENVELRRSADEVDLEKEQMVTEFEMCQQEMAQLRTQCDQLTRQLNEKANRKGADDVERENRLSDLNDRLTATQHLLESSNRDRQRLRDDLNESRRASTEASRQLMRLRDQFSTVRRGGSDPVGSGRDVAHKLEGQRHPSEPAGVTMRSRGAEAAAAALEEMRGISRASAELRTEADEMKLQMDRVLGPMWPTRDGTMLGAPLDGSVGDSRKDHSGDRSEPYGALRPADDCRLDSLLKGSTSSPISPSQNSAIQMSLKGSDSIVNDHYVDIDRPSALNPTKSQSRMPRSRPQTESPTDSCPRENDNEFSSLLGHSLSSIVPKSKRDYGVSDDLSLDDEDSIMNFRPGKGNASNQNTSRKEDADPNLRTMVSTDSFSKG